MTLHLCTDCGLEAAEGELYLCADSMPYDERHHCADCEPFCGPCQDEAAKEWRAEHG